MLIIYLDKNNGVKSLNGVTKPLNGVTIPLNGVTKPLNGVTKPLNGVIKPLNDNNNFKKTNGKEKKGTLNYDKWDSNLKQYV